MLRNTESKQTMSNNLAAIGKTPLHVYTSAKKNTTYTFGDQAQKNYYYFILAYLDVWCVEKLLPKSLETQCLETTKTSCLRGKKLKGKKKYFGIIQLLIYFVSKL